MERMLKKPRSYDPVEESLTFISDYYQDDTGFPISKDFSCLNVTINSGVKVKGITLKCSAMKVYGFAEYCTLAVDGATFVQGGQISLSTLTTAELYVGGDGENGINLECGVLNIDVYIKGQ